MFKILMNGNVVETTRIYGSALRKAHKIKELFCKSGDITIEDAKGHVIDHIGGKNVFKG